ncbi:MAG TPA: hypothetical protein GXZ47_06390 [Treponema sp.]|nr:hypothetical protein [Treponema sp.]
MKETHNPENPDLIFHYNRERRLEKAPESVRKAYEQKTPKAPGIFRGLTSTPGLRSVFFVIILLFAIIIGLTLFGSPEGYVDVGSVPIKLKAFLFDEQVYFTLTCNEVDLYDKDPVAVLALVHAVNEAGVVLDEREVAGVYAGKKLVLRGLFQDHGIERVEAQVSVANSSAKTSVSVDRN